MPALYHGTTGYRGTNHGPIDWVRDESRDTETEAPVSASGSMAMSSSLPETEPWQPPHTELKNFCGTPREMRSPGTELIFLGHGEAAWRHPPSCSSRMSGVSDGSRRCTEPSAASGARPSSLRF